MTRTLSILFMTLICGAYLAWLIVGTSASRVDCTNREVSPCVTFNETWARDDAGFFVPNENGNMPPMTTHQRPISTEIVDNGRALPLR